MALPGHDDLDVGKAVSCEVRPCGSAEELRAVLQPITPITRSSPPADTLRRSCSASATGCGAASWTSAPRWRARTYAAGDAVVVQITDDCPWNAGRWRIDGRRWPAPTSPPTSVCDVPALGLSRRAHWRGRSGRRRTRARSRAPTSPARVLGRLAKPDPPGHRRVGPWRGSRPPSGGICARSSRTARSGPPRSSPARPPVKNCRPGSSAPRVRGPTKEEARRVLFRA